MAHEVQTADDPVTKFYKVAIEVETEIEDAEELQEIMVKALDTAPTTPFLEFRNVRVEEDEA